ncbi:MAG TPA: bifunctional (p)ppGpp synthetase/guanosine-3',5'-bis(diphosphate) 3'-pyrophosphohydrolase [Candidatus Cloacimonadota bacterium]|nr:bifunctional (p)ppGpp synthetase/guanosine-3',5'-bis(diphosphate) 3'-pyrophosphohydrolase [Candidatus Cloacimonadota bacterium]HPT71156.1 bifunctional (p)ppGpp synthetase/guanosine-3',5'-bis(diphosphate) 3'-pyrophosphohydrolase [Candidatus Cloacimonadota bacterium]
MKNYELTPAQYLEIIREERKDLDWEQLEKALQFALKAHSGQQRLSGEDYILHPIAVSLILSRMQADLPTLTAALLHDVLEDTDYTIQDLEERFGLEVTELVDGVTKLYRYAFHANHNRQDDQADNYRKLLISVTKDVRVILIKLADRLHNMLTLQFMDVESQRRIARETLDIYAPLANRFGLVRMQNELEDLSLKYLNPEEYKGIAGFLNETRSERDAYIHKLIPVLSFNLDKHGIKADIFGRSKHIYSIYRKRQVRKVPYSEIYDYAAIRIIVDTVEQCYSVLGIVHSLYEPIERRFRDYIARPKSNGYQSLHTVVIGPDDRKVEFQIRTHEMHLVAEEGIAAHWRYKQGTRNHYPNTDEAYEDQLKWIKRILKQENGDSGDFINLLRENLQPQFIVVVTPNNDYIKLPRESTPLDFAFAVHTEIGFRCTGAKVNGRMVPIRSTLQNGDLVEVITSSEPNPSRDWLTILKTSRARHKVRSWLQWKERQDAIRLGKEIFEKKCRKQHWKFKTEEEIREIARLVHINDSLSLYYELGTGKLLFSSIKQAIQEKKAPPETPTHDDQETQKSHAYGIRLADVHNLMINYAACCSPVPGDEVIGYITRGRGISIHRADCPNPSFRHQCESEPERVMPVQWDIPKSGEGTGHQHPAQLTIYGKNRARFVFDILGVFARYHAQPVESNTHSEANKATAHFRLWLQHSNDLDKIIQKILSIPGVEKVEKK